MPCSEHWFKQQADVHLTAGDSVWMAMGLIWTDERAEESLPCGEGTVSLCCPWDCEDVTLPVFCLATTAELSLEWTHTRTHRHVATALHGVSQTGLKFLSVKKKLCFSIIHKGGRLEATDSNT